MKIHRLPALSDNYIFVLHDETRNVAAVVDPAEALPVLDFLQQHQAYLVAIFNTHHHADHVGGNPQLLKHFPSATVYGGAHDKGRIPHQSVFLLDSDTVEFAGRTGYVLFVPGHTRAHIAYYFEPMGGDSTAPGDLFCGDTLFAGGCGRLFEGTPQQMVESLTKIRQLPENTRIWCAHEYTLKNLEFALTIEPKNEDLSQRYQRVNTMRRNQEATVPTLLALEKQTNPFLRWNQPEVMAIAQTHDPVRCFAKLRGMKDLF
ncbi:MAG: hydroxyacylglutathione hydrolase [Leptolyngbyaceae bacterium]|nr:hydroxyacylglutathione hydrolase [Leptolyngbyaceae bacterium]